jgi:hypothetical protein
MDFKTKSMGLVLSGGGSKGIAMLVRLNYRRTKHPTISNGRNKLLRSIVGTMYA